MRKSSHSKAPRRQLAAIMFTDIVGYTAMMQSSEESAVSSVKRHEGALSESIERHNGEVLNYYGDGSLTIFNSAVEAVQCAMEVQTTLRDDPPVPLRIGIHIGEILFEDGKVFGDGVNIASRIESAGEAGTVLFSRQVEEKIRNHAQFKCKSLGRFYFKNVNESLEVFALSNEGFPVPKSKALNSLRGRTGHQRSRIVTVISLVLLMLLGLFFIDKYITKSTTNHSSFRTLLAILPFENLSGDPDFQYFADGMSQELCNRLAKLDNLEILGRRACLRYRNTEMSPTDIAKELGVNYLVEGSVSKSGNLVRINSQLIDGSSGIQLGSYPYTGEIQGALEAQDEASINIARDLELDLNPDEIAAIKKRYSNDPRAYDTYLKGWMLYESCHSDIVPSREKLEGAKSYFEEAVQIDTLFSLAYAGLSAVESYFIHADITAEYDRAERARSLAMKAFELDPNLPEAYYALADLNHVLGNHADAIGDYETSLQLDPENPVAWCHLATSCRAEERYDEAIEAAKNAARLQPTYVWSHMVLATTLRRLKRWEEATGAYQFAANLEPDWHSPQYRLGQCWIEMGQYEQAIEPLEKAKMLNPRHRWTNIRLAFAYGGSGMSENTIGVLQELFESGESRFLMIEFSPHMKALRGNARFNELLDRYREKRNAGLEMSLFKISAESDVEEMIPMELLDASRGRWQIETDLLDGEFVFVANDNLNQYWGGNEFPIGESIIFGETIPVKVGKYRITIDLLSGEYSFVSTAN
jgi:adenylate cyclase